MAQKSIADKMESFRLLIFNSREPEITARLETIGIDNDYLQEGENLYNETVLLVTQQKEEYREQNQAYDTYYAIKDEAETTFERTYKMVKVLSKKNRDLQNRLQLDKSLPDTIEQWIASAINFYNLLQKETDFMVRLARFKVTPQRLISEMEAIAHLQQLRNQAIAEKGEAQEATQLRNRKLEELEDYCTELKGLSKIVMDDQSQLLEKLGIAVPS